MRPSRSGRFGYHDVLAGVRALLAARAGQPAPRIGIYTVVTRSRPQEITGMARLAANLGVDYYVPQPVSLAPGHRLYWQLSHTSSDVSDVREHLSRLYGNPTELAVPDPSYIALHRRDLHPGQRARPRLLRRCPAVLHPA
jgi:hypothetical protein